YGETTGESDEFGLPVRLNWAANYRGRATVVYGHTPTPRSEWVNRTVCIDTGCVFGGSLTALRYPEQEVVSVPLLKQYAEPKRPFLESGARSQESGGQQSAAPSGSVSSLPPASCPLTPELLDLADVTGRRTIVTRYAGRVVVHEDNAAAAL